MDKFINCMANGKVCPKMGPKMKVAQINWEALCVKMVFTRTYPSLNLKI